MLSLLFARALFLGLVVQISAHRACAFKAFPVTVLLHDKHLRYHYSGTVRRIMKKYVRENAPIIPAQIKISEDTAQCSRLKVQRKPVAIGPYQFSPQAGGAEIPPPLHNMPVHVPPAFLTAVLPHPYMCQKQTFFCFGRPFCALQAHKLSLAHGNIEHLPRSHNCPFSIP